MFLFGIGSPSRLDLLSTEAVRNLPDVTRRIGGLAPFINVSSLDHERVISRRYLRRAFFLQRE
jgi:hypothetical protein